MTKPRPVTKQNLRWVLSHYARKVSYRCGTADGNVFLKGSYPTVYTIVDYNLYKKIFLLFSVF